MGRIKLTRRQLRRLISEALLLEEDEGPFDDPAGSEPAHGEEYDASFPGGREEKRKDADLSGTWLGRAITAQKAFADMADGLSWHKQIRLNNVNNNEPVVSNMLDQIKKVLDSASNEKRAVTKSQIEQLKKLATGLWKHFALEPGARVKLGAKSKALMPNTVFKKKFSLPMLDFFKTLNMYYNRPQQAQVSTPEPVAVPEDWQKYLASDDPNKKAIADAWIALAKDGVVTTGRQWGNKTYAASFKGWVKLYNDLRRDSKTMSSVGKNVNGHLSPKQMISLMKEILPKDTQNVGAQA